MTSGDGSSVFRPKYGHKYSVLLSHPGLSWYLLLLCFVLLMLVIFYYELCRRSKIYLRDEYNVLQSVLDAHQADS